MKRRHENTILASAAALSGLCNALIGAGGGIILTGILAKLKGKDFPDKKDIYVNSQASMIPGCMLSCLIYSQKGLLDVGGFSILAIPAAIGGVIGSILLTRVQSKWIQILFSLIVIWSGARMLMS